MSDLNLFFWHRTELCSVWNDVFIFLENRFRGKSSTKSQKISDFSQNVEKMSLLEFSGW